MLKQLRNKKTAKKIWIVLAIIIVPAFVLWGLGGALRSRQESAFAGKIFGKSVSLSDFSDAMQAVKNQAIIQYGEEEFMKNQKALNLQALAWERLILLYEAKKRKIRASDQEVITLIEKYPFFQRRGQFDQRLYSEMLQFVFRTQPRAFEEETRQNIIVAKLYKAITDKTSVSAEEIKEGYRKANEEISIDYIAAVPAAFKKEIAPSAQEVRDYFDQNSFEFKEPLSFNIEYLTLNSEDKVKIALQRLAKEQDLTKVAKELGGEAKETGFFKQTDPIPGLGWAPEVMNILSKLMVGQFSPPVRTDEDYYILKLKERKEPYIPDFATIQDKVKETWIKKKAEEMALKKIEDCLKALQAAASANSGSADFAKFAKEFSLKSDSTEKFKFGSYIEGIGASDNFWTQADQLKDDEISGIIKMPSGFYIIKLNSKSPIDEEKFAAEKEEFSQELLTRKRQEYFLKFVRELKRKSQLY